MTNIKGMKKLASILTTVVIMIYFWVINPAIASANQNTISCESFAPVNTGNSALLVSLLNNNISDVTINYSVDTEENGIICQGYLEKGQGELCTIPASPYPSVGYIRNKTKCDPSGITPYLEYQIIAEISF
ncbi:hypothetical protein [Okeania sp. SIO1I7]|uniref:hypothetical protein n=1 Tax=Okeania sp. SIO1I7 TaxID=2607772 RepID=UPI0013FA2713|nr:hypothetical protein [Okeania sp. SIO1I7]NET29850.1 hypothetical protein [Okeania sp. SIO1I7]